MKQLNFDRVLQNLNSVLNLWKLRSLTIYGRTEIVKSLALPKIMYVCEMLVPSENFLKQVKSKIFTFVWKNKPPSVAYDVLVRSKLQGGLNFPDISKKVKTQNIMWVKRLLNEEESPWKIIPKFYLSNIGGINNIRSNFNVSSIPKEIPNFYKECLKSWASFVSSEPTDINEILIQPIWNNNKICQNGKSFFIKELFTLGIYSMQDIIYPNGTIKTIFDLKCTNPKLNETHFLTWMQILAAIPKKWKNTIMNNYRTLNSPFTTMEHIVQSQSILKIQTLQSKSIYLILCEQSNKLPHTSVGERILQEKSGSSIVWNNVCKNIYKTTIEPHLREFQFKIIHNYLPVNSKLFKYKLITSDRCSYCFVPSETVEHLFGNCFQVKNIYFTIMEWLESIGIEMPKFEQNVILYGLTPFNRNNALQNHILLLFKQFVYMCRDETKMLSLHKFKIYIDQIQKIEYKIAKKNNKIICHLNKWQNLKQ